MNVLPKTLPRQDWVPKITFLMTNFILVYNFECDVIRCVWCLHKCAASKIN
jgi:hypothetical protein